MNFSVQSIISSINSDFAKTYKGAAPFINNGDYLWNYSIQIISNPTLMNHIIWANDILGVPPTKSFVKEYMQQHPDNTPNFTPQERQWIGSLFGYIFKFIFGYQRQKDRVPINILGVKTAALFLDCPTQITVI